MKTLLPFAIALLYAGQAVAGGEPIYLICKGTPYESQISVEHKVTVFGDKAQVDGHDYAVIPNETYFALVGPSPGKSTIMQISRFDGGYFIDPLPGPAPGTRGHALETSSKDRDEGCKKVDKPAVAE